MYDVYVLARLGPDAGVEVARLYRRVERVQIGKTPTAAQNVDEAQLSFRPIDAGCKSRKMQIQVWRTSVVLSFFTMTGMSTPPPFSFAPWLEDEDHSSDSFTVLADIPPPFPPNTTAVDQANVDQALLDHWEKAGGYLTMEQRDVVGVHATYGEITATGTRQLAHEFGLHELPPRSARFMDIGSGVGKLVTHLWLEYGAVERSIGVEISRSRHEQGVRALHRLLHSGRGSELRRAALSRGGECPSDAKDDSDGVVELVHGDAFSEEDSAIVALLRETTHIYVASLCFPEVLMGALSRLVRNETRTPSLVAVASILEIPGLHGGGGSRDRVLAEAGLANDVATGAGWLVNEAEMQMSWSRASLTHVVFPVHYEWHKILDLCE